MAPAGVSWISISFAAAASSDSWTACMACTVYGFDDLFGNHGFLGHYCHDGLFSNLCFLDHHGLDDLFSPGYGLLNHYCLDDRLHDGHLLLNHHGLYDLQLHGRSAGVADPVAVVAGAASCNAAICASPLSAPPISLCLTRSVRSPAISTPTANIRTAAAAAGA